MDRSKIHIGKLVKSVVKSHELKDVDFANLINKTRQNVYDLYKRDTVDVKLLLTISEALDYDFFKHFVRDPQFAETEVSVIKQLKLMML